MKASNKNGHCKLFPKSKFNWRAAPLLIHHRPEGYKKILEMDDARQDAQRLYGTLMHYCDCGPKGQPATWNSRANYLKLRDGRVISLNDIIDAIWDSAARQKKRVEEFLAMRDAEGEVLLFSF